MKAVKDENTRLKRELHFWSMITSLKFQLISVSMFQTKRE